MFKIIIAIVLFATANAAAEELDICASMHGAAYRTMTSRQEGAPITKMMKLATAAEAEDKTAGELLKATVISPYGEPRYSTEEMQEKVIADSANNWATACYNDSNLNP